MWVRPQVDLFTSHRNHQLLWFCRTSHLLVAASNALSQPWTGLSLHAYSPILLQEKTDQDQGGSGKRGHCHGSPLAEEVLIPPSPPDDVRHPPLATMQTESPVTMPPRQGHALPHQLGDPPVDGVGAEWRTLQDKGFSDAAIRTILAATHDTSQRCTVADGRASLAGVERGSESRSRICEVHPGISTDQV